MRAEGLDPEIVDGEYVVSNFFPVLGVTPAAGRLIGPEDDGTAADAPAVAIVSWSYWKSRFNLDPAILGKRLVVDDVPVTVIGVTPRGLLGLRVGSAPRVDPRTVAPAARRTVRDLLKTVPVAKVTTLAAQVDASIVPERLIATLSGVSGALGALLAAVGLYGLLAYTVARRIPEIGVRMALGAGRGQVLRMVLGDALGMAAAGLVIGAPAALWARRLAASLVPGLP